MPTHRDRIARLYRQHCAELVRFLSRRLACRDQAADLVHELFARLLARESSVAGIRHDRGFLFGSARFLAAEARRSPRWRESGAGIEAPDEEPGAPDPETLLAHREQATRLLHAISRLPPRCREAFILHRFDGLSYPEVAERLGISASAVEKHMMHALDICRAALDDYGISPE